MYSDPQLAGIFDWLTIDIPGVTAPRDIVPVAYNAWRAQVLARGNTPVRMPSGPNAGKYAERYRVPSGGFQYANAPQAVWDEEAKIVGMEQRQIAAGPKAERVENILKGLKPPNLVESLTGIPSWLVPVLLLGGGYMILKSKLAK